MLCQPKVCSLWALLAPGSAKHGDPRGRLLHGFLSFPGAPTIVELETLNYLIYSVYSLKCFGHYISIYTGKSFCACFL